MPTRPRIPRTFVLCAACFTPILLFLAHPLQAQWRSAGNVDSYVTRGGNSLTMKSGGSTLEMRLLAEDLVFIRFSPPPPSGYAAPAPSPSWAVTKTSWPEIKAEITDTPDAVTFATGAIRVQVRKRPLRIAFLDTAGRVIAGDDPQKGMAWVQRPRPDSLRDARGTAGAEVRVWKSMPEDERYYGFGERAGAFERRGTHMTMWNSDIPAYTAGTDPLYQTIPFFLGKRGGKTYGIFFDNTYRSSFDMGKESRDQYSFGAEGGPLEYYFFAGPDPRTVIRRFTELVGRMPIPPRWSLGYQQSRWSYTPEARVRQIARGFRENRIPCDVLYLDIDYMDGYRVFTWNPTGFPDPRTLVRDLAADGFRTAVILDPGIKTDSTYAAYRSGLQGDVFLKYPDGRIFVGDVWPGRCAFPDFTSDGARRWWGDQLAALAETGIRGWWNDMNEPSVFNVPTKTVGPSSPPRRPGRKNTPRKEPQCVRDADDPRNVRRRSPRTACGTPVRPDTCIVRRRTEVLRHMDRGQCLLMGTSGNGAGDVPEPRPLRTAFRRERYRRVHRVSFRRAVRTLAPARRLHPTDARTFGHQ